VPSVPSQAIARAVRTSASQQGFRLNSAQERSLILLSERVTQGPGDGGVYLWGPAGRGKTWLVDAVLDAAQAADLENVRADTQASRGDTTPFSGLQPTKG